MQIFFNNICIWSCDILCKHMQGSRNVYLWTTTGLIWLGKLEHTEQDIQLDFPIVGLFLAVDSSTPRLNLLFHMLSFVKSYQGFYSPKIYISAPLHVLT